MCRFRSYTVTLFSASLVLAVASMAQADEIKQTFRGERYDLKLFRPTGANLTKTIRAEAQGLRLQLPAERPNSLPVGLISRSGLHGDFEITVSFEIIRVDRPKEGRGAGLSIWMTQRTPEQDAATIAWLCTTEGERAFIANCASTKATGERDYQGAPPRPTKTTFGKLRFRRENGQLSYEVAEGASSQFQQLYQIEWSNADIDQIRIAADSGSSPTVVDVRLKEIVIRADELGAARVVATPQSRWQLWLGTGTLVCLLIVIGIWSWRRHQ